MTDPLPRADEFADDVQQAIQRLEDHLHEHELLEPATATAFNQTQSWMSSFRTLLAVKRAQNDDGMHTTNDEGHQPEP